MLSLGPITGGEGGLDAGDSTSASGRWDFRAGAFNYKSGAGSAYAVAIIAAVLGGYILLKRKG